MLLLLMLALVVITCIGMKFAHRGELLDDYLSRERTTSIKGFFAVIIVFSHMTQYLTMSNAFDSIYAKILWLINQFMVVMFFFYSGYGILEAVKKHPDYFKSFFRTRFLKTLVHFDLAVALFIALNAFFGKTFSPKTILLSLLAWKSVGNSAWFIFATLAMYLITLLSFVVLRKNKLLAALLTTILTVGLIIFLAQYKPGYWYNTLLCYPLGMFYSLCKDKIEAKFKANILLYEISLWGCAFIAAVLPAVYSVFKLRINYEVIYLIMSCAFSLFIVFASMKVKAQNKILYWLGINSFSIYILQRLPMIVLQKYGMTNNNIVFALIAIAATLIIAQLFTWLTNAIDKLLFSKKN